MLFSKNNRLRRKVAKQLQLSLLITFSAGIALHNANAATIYQCKQEGGKMAFQDAPCAQSDSQSVVNQTIKTPPKKAAAVNASEPFDSKASEYAGCHLTGIKVFDPLIPQGLQHPQAAFNLCKKTISSPMNENGICLNACVQAWVGEYKKKYIGNDQ